MAGRAFVGCVLWVSFSHAHVIQHRVAIARGRSRLPVCLSSDEGRCPLRALGEHESVLAAVEEHGVFSDYDSCFRVTASDIATTRGYALSTASSTLKLLAAEVDGAMEVTATGQILFVFPRGCRQRLLSAERSTAGPKFAWLTRSSRALIQGTVGLLLLASLALVRPLLSDKGGVERVSLRRELRSLRAALRPVDEDVGSATEADLSSCSLALSCFYFMFGHRAPSAVAAQEAQWAAIASAIRANKGASLHRRRCTCHFPGQSRGHSPDHLPIVTPTA